MTVLIWLLGAVTFYVGLVGIKTGLEGAGANGAESAARALIGACLILYVVLR